MKRLGYGLSTIACAVALLGAWLTPIAVRAEEAAESPARALFKEGRKLASEGKFEQACPKFEESLRLEVGVGTQFNLADCWERTGRTASAYALFQGAAASAKAVGQTDREQVLRERAAALEPRLSRLVIEVQAADPKLRVKRGELPVEAEAWGKAVPVDPGSYVIVAQAPGKQVWEKRVEVKPGTAIVTVAIPRLEPEQKALVAPSSKPKAEEARPGPRKAEPPPAPASAPSSDRDRPPNYLALTVGAIGVGSVGVGVLMGLQYQSVNDEAKAICPTSQNCSRKQIDDHSRLVDSARASRNWSYATFTVGALSLAGAGVLWYFKIPKPRTKTSWQAAPLVAADGTLGASLGGFF